MSRHRHLGSIRDDRGSLPMLMLVVLVGMALAALMVPLVITQAHTTTFDSTRGRALHAAESGIDIALGQVRAATSVNKDGVVQGDAKKLPCGPLKGSVGVGSSDQYSVTIAYYTGDPNAHPAQWAIDHKMICVSGYGVRDKDENLYTPSYVLLESSGSDPDTGDSRTLVATYVVKTTNTNIPGGPIRIWPSGSTNYCMDAGTTPVSGSTVKLSLCPTGNQALSKGMSFIYNTDLTIQVAASVGDTSVNSTGNGLCLSSNGTGSSITLTKCSAPGSPPWTQVWSVDDSSHLRGSNSSKSDTSDLCIEAASQASGTTLKLQSCAGSTTDTKQTWVPSPSVGAGQAGAANSQLVNFQQFGRCLDVTNQRVTGSESGEEFLILYTCKQNPNPSKVAWNQKFAAAPAIVTGGAPASAQWVTNNGSQYCLTSPGTEGGYVTVTPCSNKTGTVKTQQTWTTYQTQDASKNELAYKDKFTIRDYKGRCLSLSDSTDLYHDAYQKAIVEVCDGSSQQKWNAQANVQDPVLENIHEK